MEIHFKKLLNESIEDTITKTCAQYCQPEKNQLGFCPPICIPFCYPTCYRSFLAGIPPLPPDIITKPLNNNQEEDQHKPPLVLVTLLLILLVVLSIFLCYTINNICKSWHDSRTESPEIQRREGEEERGVDLDHELEVDHPTWYIRSVGLEPSVISSITIWKYKKGDGVIEGNGCVCVVCLNEFREGETLRILPKCNHAFHIPCIDIWLRSHTSCPMCRADVVFTPVGLPSPEQNGGNSEVLEEISSEGVTENERERANDVVQDEFQAESEVKHGTDLHRLILSLLIILYRPVNLSFPQPIVLEDEARFIADINDVEFDGVLNDSDCEMGMEVDEFCRIVAKQSHGGQ